MIYLQVYLVTCFLLFIYWIIVGLSYDLRRGRDHKFGYAIYDREDKKLVIFKSAYMFFGMAVYMPILNIIFSLMVIYRHLEDVSTKYKQQDD